MNLDLKTDESWGQMEVVERIETFRAEFGDNHLILARYAAFPLILTPELLYLIRSTFVASEIRVPRIAVARILLSSFYQEICDETYEIDIHIRQQLLKDFSGQKLTQLGRFILRYLEKSPDINVPQQQNIKEIQKITALCYVKPKDAARILTLKLSNGIDHEDVKEAVRWTKLIKALASPLTKAGLKTLVTYNDIVINAALDKTDSPDYENLIHKFKHEESELIQKLGLPDRLNLPLDSMGSTLGFSRQEEVLNSFLRKFKINLNPLKLPVATIIFSEEKMKQWQAETVYVNSQGKIIRRELISGHCYDEIITNLPIVGRQTAPSANAETIRMIAIPPGEFWMGSPGETDDYKDEKPPHKVKISPFFLSQTLITQAQWRAVASLPQEQRELNPNPSRFQGDNLPVEGVSWQEALEFCARLSRYAGKNYRLPSEAEWEYACRAITKGEKLPHQSPQAAPPIGHPIYPPFHFGDTITSALANYNGSLTYKEEPVGEYRKKTTPVGSFPPNAFGLYDMHGNVWEWCLDPWHENYEGAPDDGRVWDEKNEQHYQNLLGNISRLMKYTRPRKGTNHPQARIIRGGSWNYSPWFCRSAYRFLDFDLFMVGLRIVCILEDKI